VPEVDGIAIFRNDRLTSFLTPQESKFFLIAMGESQGGILPLSMSGYGPPDTALEISGSKAKTSYTNEGGQLMMKIETETDVYLAETMKAIDVLNEDQVKALEEEAGKRLALEITTLIHKVQTQIGADIFGFGDYIHRHDVRLWETLKDQWDAVFVTLPVQVSCKVNIRNTASIKSQEAARQ
jgi:spore germination protein KC